MEISHVSHLVNMYYSVILIFISCDLKPTETLEFVMSLCLINFFLANASNDMKLHRLAFYKSCFQVVERIHKTIVH